MSGGVMILLIIVVWLFVLAPLLLRGQRAVNKTGEAFEDTRVLFEGDSGDVPARPQPRLRREDIGAYGSHRNSDSDEDWEVVVAEDAEDSADDILIEEPPAGRIIDGEVVDTEADVSADEAVVAEDTGSTAASVVLADQNDDDDDDNEEDSYSDEDTSALLTPTDLMVRDDTAVPVAEDTAAEKVTEPEPELTEEDMAYAQRRAGRGGYDPERDRQFTQDRYQRRRRTLAGLVGAVAVTALIGVIAGGWWWILFAIATALTVFYLVALRNQVRAEKELRARRIRHLRRARLGVRSAEADELNVPRSLRRPGAVVMEMDDESPDFDYLPEIDSDLDTTPGPDEPTTLGGSHRRAGHRPRQVS